MAKDSNTPDYGNWVPKKLIILLWCLTVVVLGLSIAGFILGWNMIINVILLLGGLYALFMSISMTGLRWTFSFTGGRLMCKIHDFILTKLGWNGEGKLLDVGCGSGALSIKIARKFPKGEIHGLDYWGFGWDYAKKICEGNAKLEGVTNASFQKGDACHLDFPDESFDAVVSNFVYHEVKTEPDKRKLVRESLRVLKKGGYFALHDLMDDRKLYGDMNEFVEELKKEGFEEVHYQGKTENLPFVPGYARTFMMFNKLGILYGRK